MGVEDIQEQVTWLANWLNSHHVNLEKEHQMKRQDMIPKMQIICKKKCLLQDKIQKEKQQTQKFQMNTNIKR